MYDQKKQSMKHISVKYILHVSFLNVKVKNTITK